MAAVLLVCCAALTAAGEKKSAAPAAALGRAKLKAVVMTPYPGSRQNTGNEEPAEPGHQGGPVPLPNYRGETLTLGLLTDDTDTGK